MSDDLLDDSLFVSETIHEREITLADGKKSRLWFREISSADFEKIRAGSGDATERHAALSRAIAASLCKPDGTPAMTAKRASQLKDGVRLALSMAIAEVNGIGASVGKVSPPGENSGSGASSSFQESADDPSKKQSDGSAGANS